MIAIISAMDVEMQLLKQAMIIKEERIISHSTYYIGTLEGTEIVLVKCGVGKVNAAMSAQTLSLVFEPKLIINLGVSGGMGKDIKIGDIVIIDSCVQHDFDTSEIDNTPVGTITTNKGDVRFFDCDNKYSDICYNLAHEMYEGATHRGVAATGDSFISDPEKCKFLQEEFGAVSCEMEIGSIAQVCYLNEIPLVSLKSISDNADDDGKMDFLSFAEKSAHRNEEFLKKILSGNYLND